MRLHMLGFETDELEILADAVKDYIDKHDGIKRNIGERIAKKTEFMIQYAQMAEQTDSPERKEDEISSSDCGSPIEERRSATISEGIPF